jgi:hypothetical protein
MAWLVNNELARVRKEAVDWGTEVNYDKLRTVGIPAEIQPRTSRMQVRSVAA